MSSVRTTGRGSRGPRSGFTLPEMLVALGLFAIVMGAIVGTMRRQQRFYSDAASIIEVRRNVRQLADLLPSEMRAIAPVGGDIYAMTDSSLDFRAPLGASMLCVIDAGRASIVLPPTQLARQNALSAWSSEPGLGDSLFVYDEGNSLATADDSWRVHEITSAFASGSCPLTNRLVTTAGEAALGLRLSISPALAATVTLNAPIRFFRRARYSLYRAPNTNWYVGYLSCRTFRTPVCDPIDAISGPYLPYGAAGGLTFTYYDSAGTITATPARVARIDFVARAETPQALGSRGPGGLPMRDSLNVRVAIRNRQ